MMRVFKEPNLSNNWRCPICGTNDKKEVVLIPTVGTQEGHNAEAEQFHLECINLWYDKESRILMQKFDEVNKNGSNNNRC